MANFISQRTWPQEKGLRMGALNICSLLNKIEDLRIILDNNGQPLHVFGVSESRCSKRMQEFINVPNYDLIISNPISSPDIDRVGLAVYIHDTVNFKHRSDLEHPLVECIWLKINIQNTSFLLGQIYRNPNSGSSWLSAFCEMMDNVSMVNLDIVLIGDLNFNLLVEQKTWEQTYKSYLLKQIISLPSRVTMSTTSLIDHIYVTNTATVIENCVPISGISDHYPVFCTLRYLSHRNKIKNLNYQHEHKYIYYRCFKKFKEEKFLADLTIAPFDNIYGTSDPSILLDLWIDIFINIIDRHAPIKCKRIKRSIIPPWITPLILHEMKIRDKLKSQNNHGAYKQQRNKVKSMQRSAKKLFINDLIRNKSDPSSIWKAIKILKNQFTESKQYEFSPDEFNVFFTGVADMLIKQCFDANPNQCHSASSHILNDFVRTHHTSDSKFEIPLMSVSDVYSYLTSLKLNKSVGLDKISNRFLKIAAPIISGHLTFIYNQCLCTGIIPDRLKSAKVIPLHKKGSMSDLNNFRPISVLSALVKPLEKHINTNLMKYFESNSLFHSSQSAFRKYHSCQSAVLKITETYFKVCNNSTLAGTVFVDFSKAFDMINHRILLCKLKQYGISEPAVKVLTSYLDGRTQRVCIGSDVSDLLPIHHGVPQGSILGPLLFSIYINDLPLHITYSDCELFADDTTLLCTASNVSLINDKLGGSLNQLMDWCKMNAMVVNPKKSECMLVCTRQKRQRLSSSSLNLIYANECIPQVSHHKLLGIIIDQNLQWADHVDMVSNKVAIKVFQLNCIKHFLNLDVRKMFYFAYIQPHIDFCSSVWGHCAPSHLKRLISMQRRSLKSVYCRPVADTSSLFPILNILPVTYKFTFNDCVVMHSVVFGHAPHALVKLFIPQTAEYFVDDYLFILPLPKKDIYKSSFSYTGAYAWTNLPLRLRSLSTLSTFKKSLFDFLHVQN